MATNRPRFRLTMAVALAACAVVISGCSSTPPVASPSPSTTSSPGRSATPSATPTQDPLAGLTLEQRVGQLFMMGTTAAAAQRETRQAVRDRHVGNIFLSGRSSAGVKATAAVVARFRALVNSKSTGGVPLLVSTDQEGGQVQVLRGPGFSTIPSGLAQGRMSTGVLRTAARTWATQLESAGVNMDLAPVVDLVASPVEAAKNPPIGVFQREFGFTAPTIVAHANAFRAGMTSARVLTAIKHFPGLGFVSANTDTTRGVTDTVTGTNGANVAIYRAEIADGANCIMVSSAKYARIDPNAPAVFSSRVVTQLLRIQLGFTGVIMSDDLSGATQVLGWTPAQRAIMAIEAGVDIVLVSRFPDAAARMVDAVVARAKADSNFAALVDAAVRRVLELKSHL
ncbi:MAG: Beta-N-acetylhexosaminidase [Glaciihabitans sp.]|nr:Beta-N-acetylhexosaminidase [Glaciihabitans sp.]